VPYDPAQADDPAFVASFEENFAEAVNSLTRDPDKAKAFGRAGRERCIAEFSWDAIADQTIKVYQQAIERFAG